MTQQHLHTLSVFCVTRVIEHIQKPWEDTGPIQIQHRHMGLFLCDGARPPWDRQKTICRAFDPLLCLCHLSSRSLFTVWLTQPSLSVNKQQGDYERLRKKLKINPGTNLEMSWDSINTNTDNVWAQNYHLITCLVCQQTPLFVCEVLGWRKAWDLWPFN